MSLKRGFTVILFSKKKKKKPGAFIRAQAFIRITTVYEADWAITTKWPARVPEYIVGPFIQDATSDGHVHDKRRQDNP